MVPPQDQRMIAAGPTMVTQAYTGQVTRDCMNAAQQELSRRPPDVRESLRHFVQRDAALPFGSSVGQPPDVQVLSGVVRGPLVGVDQPMRVVDHQMVDNMKCETCLRPAMFICSACRKAAYCSVDCQVRFPLGFFTLFEVLLILWTEALLCDPVSAQIVSVCCQ